MSELSTIVEPLLDWYERVRRPLPWRESPTPYHIWLSEIMLQQTRIEAVIPYYERFLVAFPTVEALAHADDDRLMKLWEGLGYYSRARNLKRAAICIVEQHGGQLPASYEALRGLPGVGPYTAGAIASIAYGLREPAVDGNVLRVVTRLLANESDITKESTKRRLTDELRNIYPEEGVRCAAMTQALMELGERVCIPNGAPHCEECPLGASCLARARALTDCIPCRTPKKARQVKERTIFLLWCDGKVALRRRPETGLLSGLWEFPGADAWLDVDKALDHLATRGVTGKGALPTPDAKHIFTHIEWHMKGYFVQVEKPSGDELVWVTREELAHQYALPTAFRAFVRALDDFCASNT